MATPMKTIRAVDLDIPVKENTDGTFTVVKSVMESIIDGERVFNAFGTILEDEQGTLNWDFVDRITEEKLNEYLARGVKRKEG